MDIILFIVILILVFIGVPIGLGLLIYFIPKKLGHPKVARYLSIAYGLLVLTIGLYIAFEDQLFTKNNAKEFVEEQDFILKDDFEILKNESKSSIGDYYHTFTLEITKRDKDTIILKIKSSENFKPEQTSIEPMINLSDPRYFGQKVIQNYETKYSYVREYYKLSGQKGYAPILRRISISKTNNELTFEDIDD